MSIFQNQTRSTSNIKTPIKNRNFRNSIGSKTSSLNGAVSWSSSLEDDSYKVIMQQANTIKLIDVCRHYGIELNEFNKQIQCPFKFHRDSSPSFTYYPDDNTFHCFGCKNTGGSAEFLSLLEGISKIDAANKLLDSFESDEIDPKSFVNYKERDDLYLRFSLVARNFIRNNGDSDDALKFIDGILKIFDAAAGGRIGKRKMEIDGLKHIADELEKRIGNYGCQ